MVGMVEWTRGWVAAGVSAAVLAGCGEPDDPAYKATIRWGENGVPHVLARDIESASFAQGYAFARLNGCILADQIVKIRGERAAFLGPGEMNANIESDQVHRFLGFADRGEDAFEAQPPEASAVVTAYAAGFNHFVESRGDELPCGGEPWLTAIKPEDLMGHYVELMTLAGVRQFHGMITDAIPPTAGELQRAPTRSLSEFKIPEGPGSNGWAIGSERSENGHGMLIGNPHFPWEGELRLYESHLEVPGELNVYGASLMAVPGVLIGFNEAVAWTHTVSAGNRFTAYILTLDPADPTRYMYAGESRAMEGTEITVDVREADGSLTQRTRTFWSSQWGPILAPFGWGREQILTIRDANIENDDFLEQFLRMNASRSMEEFQRAHEDVQGIPWVNTISVSAEGLAWYADTTPTPNLSPEAIDWWLNSTDATVLVLRDNGAVAIPGDDPMFEWVEEPGARDPGLVPFARMPQIERNDFVFNSNDSYWLSNPIEPLEGFSPMHGMEGTPRSPRTRMNAQMLLETGQGTSSGVDGQFDLNELSSAILSNRGMMAELLRDQVVARCEGVDTVMVEDVEVPVGEACAALAAWDLRLDLASSGALVWREFLGEFSDGALADEGVLFANGFDRRDPIATPNTLTPAPQGRDEPDEILRALGGAVTRLGQAGIPVTATLGEVQFTKKGEERIPIHGGGRNEGVANLIIYTILKSTAAPDLPRGEVINTSTDLTNEGYVINYGSSFLMAMRFTDTGPEARAFLTYSQSEDPSSPYFADQTRLFSAKDWRTIRYDEMDILSDPELEIQDLELPLSRNAE